MPQPLTQPFISGWAMQIAGPLARSSDLAIQIYGLPQGPRPRAKRCTFVLSITNPLYGPRTPPFLVATTERLGGSNAPRLSAIHATGSRAKPLLVATTERLGGSNAPRLSAIHATGARAKPFLVATTERLGGSDAPRLTGTHATGSGAKPLLCMEEIHGTVCPVAFRHVWIVLAIHH